MNQSKPADSAKVTFDNRNILLLDDEQIFCTLLTDVLTPYGYQLYSANSSKEAFEHFGKVKFAVAVLDYNLAENTTGLDIIKEIRKADKDVEIVMITGNPSLEVALEAFEEGLYDYLVKPVNVRKVKQVIDRALEKYHLKKQHEILHEDLLKKNRQLEESNKKLTDALNDSETFQSYLANSQKMAGVGEMTASIAHEFNNILGAIRGYTQLALRSPDNLKFALQAHEKIKICADKASKVIHNLLLFSKRVIPERKAGDINEALKETISLCQHHLDMKNVQLKMKFGKLPSFRFDKGQLQQVFLNMVMNACQALPNQGELSITSICDNNVIRIEFVDNGKGISPENLENIFMPFFTTKSKKSREYDGDDTGTGLGLFVSQKVVRAHNGEIKVRSDAGIGTCFEILLPVESSAAGQIRPAVSTPETSSTETSMKPTAMVVDDDPHIREVLEKFLQDHGFNVFKAENGQECLNLLEQKGAVHLIFMDLTMPRINGEEALHTIKDQYPETVVYVMSGYGTKRKIHNILTLGAERYIAKPFDLDELEQYVNEDMEILNLS